LGARYEHEIFGLSILYKSCLVKPIVCDEKLKTCFEIRTKFFLFVLNIKTSSEILKFVSKLDFKFILKFPNLLKNFQICLKISKLVFIFV
jgi:hypothetical protein